MLSRRAALVFGLTDLATAALILFGVFVALPDRWWPVDLSASVLCALELGAGAGLLLGRGWGPRLARAASAIALAFGLLTVTALAVSASWVAGVYGSIGSGGAIILTLTAALLVPYLVALPLVQLVWLRSSLAQPQA
jgi:hypothetical protein